MKDGLGFKVAAVRLVPSPYMYWMVFRSLKVVTWISMACCIPAVLLVDSFWPLIVTVVFYIIFVQNFVVLKSFPKYLFIFGERSWSPNTTVWDWLGIRLRFDRCPDCKYSIFCKYPEDEYHSTGFNANYISPFPSLDPDPLHTIGFWPQPYCVQCGRDLTRNSL